MTQQKVPCCKKCDDIGFCRPAASCCVQCHFAFEERVASPYLPAGDRAWLRAQHKYLKAEGYPPLAVERHALDEMRLFRRYCPQDIVDLIQIDHGEHELGNLRDRDA